jgi:hypothetical protein
MDSDKVEGTAMISSRRMGPLDIPICLLNFVRVSFDTAATVAGDITFLLCAHANWMHDQKQFKEIVKNYDDPHCVGTGGPEPQDGSGTSSEAEGTA